MADEDVVQPVTPADAPEAPSIAAPPVPKPEGSRDPIDQALEARAKKNEELEEARAKEAAAEPVETPPPVAPVKPAVVPPTPVPVVPATDKTAEALLKLADQLAEDRKPKPAAAPAPTPFEMYKPTMTEEDVNTIIAGGPKAVETLVRLRAQDADAITQQTLKIALAVTENIRRQEIAPLKAQRDAQVIESAKAAFVKAQPDLADFTDEALTVAGELLREKGGPDFWKGDDNAFFKDIADRVNKGLERYQKRFGKAPVVNAPSVTPPPPPPPSGSRGNNGTGLSKKGELGKFIVDSARGRI